MKTFKKIFASVLISCYSFLGVAQTNDQPQKQHKEITIGKVDSIYSKILKEQRKFWIYTPQKMDPAKRYPIIYVLDASSHFHIVTGMIKRLAPLKMPESIVVGIKNTDRTRDFTPTKVKFSRGRKTPTSGGAANFLKFVIDELQCHIQNLYPTESNSTLIGHSTAGLFTLYAYLNTPQKFDNYIAIDPSLWWDRENLVKHSQELIDKGNFQDKSLYIAVANSLGKKLDTVKVRSDRSEITEQIRANLKFHDILVQNNKKLDFAWEYFKNEDHGAVTVPGQYNGIRSVFEWFPFHKLWRFNTPKQYSAKQLTQPFYEHYNKLSKRLKRKVAPDWDLVNDIATYMLQGHKLPKKALAYLEINLHFHPKKSKTYVALGNFYLHQKNKEKAIENFKKAVAIDNNASALQKLRNLKLQ